MNLADAYLEDAKAQLSLAAPLIKEQGAPTEQWRAVLFVAIGVEKLLKHILASINPALVLKAMDYESTVVACHSDQVTFPEKLKQLQRKANSEAITIRTAVQRASLFSAGVRNQSQFIHALADLRDIAAHRPWVEADRTLVRRVLCRDLYLAISEILMSSGIDAEEFFRDHVSRLQQLSEKITGEENLNAQMESLLADHRATWETRKSKPDLVELAKKLTCSRLAAEPYAADLACPACGNDAIAILEPDIDYDYNDTDGTAYATVIGVSVDHIRCFYCSLLLDKYDQLRYVDADSLLAAGGKV